MCVWFKLVKRKNVGFDIDVIGYADSVSCACKAKRMSKVPIIARGIIG